jgi:glycosyltransferase involved in cell wall biosynthesis
MRSLVINWPLSSMTGYGIYGLQILVHYLRRGGHEFALTDRLLLPIDLPPEIETRLRPLLEKASRSAAYLDEHPKEILGFDGAVLHGVGNAYASFHNQYRVKGRPNIGCAAIEEAICPPDWLPFLKIYDRFIAISQWNEDYLSSLGLQAPVHLCHQGIDTNLFRPGPRSNLWPGRFAIFSGGKFEFRKGQDIVIAAFKRFREKHSDALLVTSWQNHQVVDAAPFVIAGHCTTTPQLDASGTKLDIAAWLHEQDLPEGSFIDLGWQHNSRMAEILHGCDVAIFPNRCEGGTNLVAMETLACGVPAYVSANTGQNDLISLIGTDALLRQKPVKSTPGILSVEGWGESDVDEIVAALERAYAHPDEMRQKAATCAERMKGWDWAAQNEKLLQLVYGVEWPKA